MITVSSDSNFGPRWITGRFAHKAPSARAEAIRFPARFFLCLTLVACCFASWPMLGNAEETVPAAAGPGRTKINSPAMSQATRQPARNGNVPPQRERKALALSRQIFTARLAAFT
jgi:hypothetical protein